MIISKSNFRELLDLFKSIFIVETNINLSNFFEFSHELIRQAAISFYFSSSTKYAKKMAFKVHFSLYFRKILSNKGTLLQKKK